MKLEDIRIKSGTFVHNKKHENTVCLIDNTFYKRNNYACRTAYILAVTGGKNSLTLENSTKSKIYEMEPELKFNRNLFARNQLVRK